MLPIISDSANGNDTLISQKVSFSVSRGGYRSEGAEVFGITVTLVNCDPLCEVWHWIFQGEKKKKKKRRRKKGDF